MFFLPLLLGVFVHSGAVLVAAHPVTGNTVRAVQTSVRELALHRQKPFLRLARERFSFMSRDDNNSYYPRYPDQPAYPDQTGKTVL